MFSLCVFALCFRFVFSFCVFVMCFRFVFSFCVFVLCFCFVFSFYVFAFGFRFKNTPGQLHDGGAEIPANNGRTEAGLPPFPWPMP